MVARRTAELAASRDTLQRLVQQTPVGIQIFDKSGLCVEVNQMHLDIFGVPNREQLVGKYNIFDDPLLVGTDAGAKRALAGETVYLDDLTFDFSQAESRYAANTGQRIISAAFFPVFDENGQVANIVALNQDITERKQAEMEREKLIGELQEALTRVKTLSGLLPICASCKKIRDDGGYWHQVEAYIRDYSEAEFSHGICPDCMKKLYPEFFEDNQSIHKLT
jgi:PAS domain S-box-containing protein